MKSILVFVTVLVSFLANASTVPQYGFTKEQNEEMASHNSKAAQFEQDFPTLFGSDSPLSFNLLETSDATAFAEYEEAGYLIFSENFAFSSKKAKRTMAEHLPEGVQLVIFSSTSSKAGAEKIKEQFEDVIDTSRITVIHTPNASGGFWARDSVPVPVFRKLKAQNGVELFTVVDARYSRFEQDKRFSEFFGAEMTSYNYFYEGGNFIANAKNECLIVNKVATAEMPDKIFQQHYGCKVLTRLPHVKGIGHADESVKFVDDKTVLTDEKSYVSTLEGRGYDVILLPRPNRRYETYVNSLIVNGVVYVPIFNESGDETALQVYRDLGYKKVIGINTETLSNTGLGSLHCITMTYPPVEMSELLSTMGGAVIK